MDRGAWQATVHGVTKSQTQLSDTQTHTDTHTLGCIYLFELGFSPFLDICLTVDMLVHIVTL